MQHHMRRHLSAPGLLSKIRERFSLLKDPLENRTEHSLCDCLMSGLAVFVLKYSSLLQFDRHQREELVRHNLEKLYGVSRAPCDTYLRERLDKLLPKRVESGFKVVLSEIQKSHFLESYRFMDGYLVPIDGTGVFYSDKVHCKHCCEKHHQDDTISYYHQILVATIVHPDYKPVLPLSCESIRREDGMKKNDCELNASQRLIEKLRHQHPQLPMILVEDALYANGPHIRALRAAKMRHITVVKPKDHVWLFDWVKASKKNRYECSEANKKHVFEWVADVPLSDKGSDVRVNFLEYFETDAKGKIHHWTWVTDLPLNKDTVYQIMKGGRARWRIENETFNTLKNQGYEFEHNFGHGHKHLMDVFARLMLLAFLIDQAQLLACPLFKKALDRAGCMKDLWDRQKFLFLNCLLESWDMMFRALIERPKLIMQFDTG